MFPGRKFSMRLWATLSASLLFAATVSALAQQTTTERMKGSATVSTAQVSGEVVQVEGNDLLVKLTTGEMKTFRVPETRRFLIDGRELTVHDLRPGTTLTATVRTTTTPVTVRTRSTISGKVWYVSPPNVILTLPDGQNKQYKVKDNVRFTVEGRPGTVFDLRKGMNVSAEKIVEEPDSEITTDTTVVGRAPAMRAAAPPPAPVPPPTPAAPKPAPEPPPPAPEPPKPAPAPPKPAPAAPAPVAPEPTPPPAPEPAHPNPRRHRLLSLWYQRIPG